MLILRAICVNYFGEDLLIVITFVAPLDVPIKCFNCLYVFITSFLSLFSVMVGILMLSLELGKWEIIKHPFLAPKISYRTLYSYKLFWVVCHLFPQRWRTLTYSVSGNHWPGGPRDMLKTTPARKFKSCVRSYLQDAYFL